MLILGEQQAPRPDQASDRKGWLLQDQQSMLGGQTTISSNQGANGVLWVSSRSLLRAFNPNASGQLVPLFSSSNLPQAVQTIFRANNGGPVKFIVPVVANGYVYVGYINSLLVFGLTSPQAG